MQDSVLCNLFCVSVKLVHQQGPHHKLARIVGKSLYQGIYSQPLAIVRLNTEQRLDAHVILIMGESAQKSRAVAWTLAALHLGRRIALRVSRCRLEGAKRRMSGGTGQNQRTPGVPIAVFAAGPGQQHGRSLRYIGRECSHDMPIVADRAR